MKSFSLEINNKILKEDLFCSKTLNMDDISVIIDRTTGIIEYGPDDIVYDLNEHNLTVLYPTGGEAIDLNPSIIKAGLWRKIVEEVTEYFANDESLIEYFAYQLSK